MLIFIFMLLFQFYGLLTISILLKKMDFICIDFSLYSHVTVNPTPHANFLFTVQPNPRMSPGQMGFNAQHVSSVGFFKTSGYCEFVSLI